MDKKEIDINRQSKRTIFSPIDESVCGKRSFKANFQDPNELFLILKNLYSEHNKDDLEGIKLIEKAYNLAYSSHDGQFRKSGEAYIIHPIWVGIILTDLFMDKSAICAGILHDTVEDTFITLEDIEQEFGCDIALLVDGVTKLGQIDLKNSDSTDRQAENLRKMFLAMSKDIRVIIIKLCDRLHNMRTLEFMSPEKQIEKAKETFDIYAPIAGRLGISKVKIELDDLAFKYSRPKEYNKLVSYLDNSDKERNDRIKRLIGEVLEKLLTLNYKAKVQGRIKHYFSIYRKMVKQNKSIDEVYDLFAIRILVENVADCYGVLGAMHEKYKPIPGRFKDYIAMPKPNMYRSLHTTVLDSDGHPFEIQIRTFDMHKESEYGIGAHWKYKEKGNSNFNDKNSLDDKKLIWIRQVIEMSQTAENNKEFLSLVKSDLDLFSDNVYCFTPKGEVKILPVGSTPIDLAYSIHTAIGNRMVGARVNGKLVPINYTLKNGDRVYIITSQNGTGPSMDWLNIVKSSSAKTKINQWLKSQYKDENIDRGRELLEKYCKSKKINVDVLSNKKYQEVTLKKYGFPTWEHLLSTCGHGGIKEGQVISRILEEKAKEEEKAITDNDILDTKFKKNKNNKGIIVKGIDNIEVHFAKCCSPIPGDEIVGFITRGHGITVHRTDCINLINLGEEDRKRIIECEWKKMENDIDKYNVSLRLITENQNGIIISISQVISNLGISINEINAKVSKSSIVTINITCSVSGGEELKKLMEKLNQIEFVKSVERVTG